MSAGALTVLRVATPLGILGLGAVLRAANLGGSAFGFDELYHVLAAESLLEGRGYELAEGRPYTRARFVTLLVAGAFALFGESEAAARLPALAFGVATLALVYAAGRWLFGEAAGLVALALAALSPDLIDVSRFARLYSPLALATLAAAVGAFGALEPDRVPGTRRRPAGWALLATAAFLLAVHLHPVALGLVPVVQAYAVLRSAALAARGRGRAALPGLALAAALLVVVAGLAAVPALRRRVADAALEPLPWQDPEADPMLYHYYLAGQYGWLWYLAWPATMVAVVTAPRAGLFVALAFWMPLVAISAGVETQAPRYVTHLLPLAWVLLGAAAGRAWPAAWRALGGAAARLVPGAAPSRARARTAVAAGLAAAALLPLAGSSPSVRAAAERPRSTTGAFATGHFADWRAAARLLEGRLGPTVAIVTSVPLASRYYLGRPAVRLLAPGRSTDEWAEEGRAVVQGADDLAALRDAHEAVVVLVDAWRWRTPGKLDDRLRRALEAGCEALPLAPDTELVGFRCEEPGRLRTPRSPGLAPSGPGPPRSGAPPPGGSPR